jgi:hypothetical protein
LDPALVREVLDRLEGEAPRGRTRALFAAPGHIEVFDLDVQLPVVDEASGHVAARWGKPYVLPLLVASEELERYGAIYADRDHVRVFAVSAESIDELIHEVRPTSEAERDTLERTKESHPGYLPSRGSAAQDQAAHHVRALARRFRDEVVSHVGALVDEHSLRGLLLMGPDQDVAELERSLEPRLARMVVGRCPSPSRPDAPAHEVLERLKEPVRHAREQRQYALLDAVRENGVVGPGDTIRALQQGTLSDVVSSWRMAATVWRGKSSGWVASDQAEVARMPQPGEEIENISLLDALVDLSARYNARLTVLRGSPAQRLVDEFQGVAGLNRW